MATRLLGSARLQKKNSCIPIHTLRLPFPAELSKFPNQINLLSFEAQPKRMRKSIAYILGPLALPVKACLRGAPCSLTLAAFSFQFVCETHFCCYISRSFPLSNSTRRASQRSTCIGKTGIRWQGMDLPKKMPPVDTAH